MSDFFADDATLIDLARRHGTPLYVYDTRRLREAYDELRRALPPEVDLFYSLKANPNLSVTAFLRSLGCGADVSSGAELRFAIEAGVDPADVCFTGPGKTPDEIALAIDVGVRSIVCESADELRAIDELSAARRVRTRVALRVNPRFEGAAIDSHMSGKPTQFGIDHRDLRRGALDLRGHRNVRVDGVHVYMGSRILSAESIATNTRRILELAESIARELDFPLELVDVGGGFGVPYFAHEAPLDTTALGALLAPAVHAFAHRNPRARIVAEAGRFLVARAGIFVTRVIATKQNHGERFAVVDGGLGSFFLLSDNLAMQKPGEPERNFPVRRLGGREGEAAAACTLAGPAPTPSDVLARRALLPPLAAGDYLGVARAGAYGSSASLGAFVGGGAPAEVLLHDGAAHVVRGRDTYEDAVRRQMPLRFRSPR